MSVHIFVKDLNFLQIAVNTLREEIDTDAWEKDFQKVLDKVNKKLEQRNSKKRKLLRKNKELRSKK